MKKSRWVRLPLVLATFTLAGVGGIASAQDAGDSSGKSDQQIVDEFIADKKSDHATADKIYADRSKNADAAQMRQMVRALKFDRPQPTQGLSVDTTNQLPDLLATDAADYLTSLGWKTSDVRELARNGFDAGNAAIRVIRGGSTQFDRVILAPYVISGKIISVKSDDLNDGFGQTIAFKPEAYLAKPNGKPLPKTLLLRQSSGEITARGSTYYSGDFSENDINKSVIILVSDERYLQRSSEKGKRPKENKQSEIFVVQSAADVIALEDDGETIKDPQMNGASNVESLTQMILKYRK